MEKRKEQKMKTDVQRRRRKRRRRKIRGALQTALAIAGRKWASNMRVTSIEQDGSRRSQAARRTAL